MNAQIKNEGLVWDPLPQKPPKMVAIFGFGGGKELLFFSSNPTRKRTLWKLERKRLWRKTHYQNSDEFGWILLHLGLSTFNCHRWIFRKLGRPSGGSSGAHSLISVPTQGSMRMPWRKKGTSRWLGHGLAWIRAKRSGGTLWNSSIEFQLVLFLKEERQNQKIQQKIHVVPFWIRHVVPAERNSKKTRICESD